MRTSQFLLATVKETPADAEIVSHQLMIRAGMIRQVAAGIYNWLPLGLRVVRKIEQIVREEMNRAGAQEMLLPAVQPAELWQQSGRWDEYGPELLRMVDRHKRDFCFGPTHEEVITSLLRNEIRSYRQLPANFYQIQTKFRDEIRPRFGVMRAREFIMKDAYSFDVNQAGLQQSYDLMFEAYSRIFTRFGLEFRSVEADSGAIGGSVSCEFHVLADSGEDAIATCRRCGYAANLELVACPPPGEQRPEPKTALTKVDTTGLYNIDDVCKHLAVDATQSAKTLVVKGVDRPVALVLRGDHELNAIKAEKLSQVMKPLQLASVDEVKRATGCEPGSIGPVGLSIPIFVDHCATLLSDFTCGANEADKHLTGVNWGRDLPEPQSVDLRTAQAGEGCPTEVVPGEWCSGVLEIRRGIEVGHIFQLGTKYSKAMDATCLDQNGDKVPMCMGCYGIGVTRIAAAAIEQNFDKAGIIWPDPLAPFDVCMVPIGYQKSKEVAQVANELYEKLRDAGFAVLMDDRRERPGVMFADMDLVGIPHRLVIGERGIKQGIVEYKSRRTGDTQDIALDSLVDTLSELRGAFS
ncbi:MAG: proline--tRNA ligase [Gammaproteobacteria bacterium]|nr:proline--tRNA ligase [Gammaproteobacteria bacterium]